MTGGGSAARRPTRLRQSWRWLAEHCSCGLTPGSACRRSSASRRRPPPALVAARIEAREPARRHRPRPVRPRRLGRARRDRRASARGSASRAPPLDRLLAEIVLRPPDLRHLDAAVQALAASARRESSLKTSITDRYASRCATCERPVTLDEITWSAESDRARTAGRIGPQPTRKHYRCPVCRDQLGGGEQRQAPLDANDLRLALDRDDDERPGAPARPVPRPRGRRVAGRRAARPPHAAPAVGARRDPRADRGRPPRGLDRGGAPARDPPRARARRAGSRRHRGASPRCGSPAATSACPGGAHWRERNPWLAFEDGVRLVRGFVQRLESGAWGPVPARLGDDLRSLVEGSATAMLKQGTSGGARRARSSRPRASRETRAPAADPARPRHAAAAPGRGAARLGLPRDGVGARPRGRRDAAARAAVRARGPPVVGLAGGRRHPGAARRRADHGPRRPGRVPARGRRPGDPRRQRPRRRRRRLPRSRARGCPRPGRETGGVVELVPPGLGRGPGRRRGPARTSRCRRSRAAPATRTSCAPSACSRRPERDRRRRRSPREDAARAVVDAAVDVLKLRGEPVSFGGLLGEILVGLDRAGHLRRLVRPPAPPEDAARRDGNAAAARARRSRRRPRRAAARPRPRRPRRRPRAGGSCGSARTAGGSGERADREAAAAPLADRVEWAVYSLLSTAGPLSEAAFLDRIAGLFIGPDLPDEALVRACLDSYRSLASTQDDLVTTDDLTRRSQEHGELIADDRRARPPAGLLVLDRRAGSSGARSAASRCGTGSTTASSPARRTSAGSAARTSRTSTSSGTSAGARRSCGRSSGRRCSATPCSAPRADAARRAPRPVPRRAARARGAGAPQARAVARCSATELETGDWHILKANHLRDWASHEEVALADMEGLLGLDPAVERTGDQLALFGG